MERTQTIKLLETAVPDTLPSIPTIPGEQGTVVEAYNTWYSVGERLVTLYTYLTHKELSGNTCNSITEAQKLLDWTYLKIAVTDHWIGKGFYFLRQLLA